MNELQIAIHSLLGAAPDYIKPFEITRFSTSGAAGNRDGWVKPLNGGVYRFGCWRQGLTGTFFINRDETKKRVPSNAEFVTTTNMKLRLAKLAATRNLAVWQRAQILDSTSVVARYLVKRGLCLPSFPAVLRETRLEYFEDGTVFGVYPVMLAAITDPCGEMVGLHRTYLSADGTKAPVNQVKKLTKVSGPLSGASIKLFDPVMVDGQLTLGVAEGIETALACQLSFGMPTWSCLSAQGLQRFMWPGGMRRLCIFADNDASGVGQESAEKLAKRAANAGLKCQVLVPEKVGSDWLDVYRGN